MTSKLLIHLPERRCKNWKGNVVAVIEMRERERDERERECVCETERERERERD